MRAAAAGKRAARAGSEIVDVGVGAFEIERRRGGKEKEHGLESVMPASIGLEEEDRWCEDVVTSHG
jgi:hypothetical protein